MERTDWLQAGFDSSEARFLMLTAITHHRFDSPVWGAEEVRKLEAELAEIEAAVTSAVPVPVTRATRDARTRRTRHGARPLTAGPAEPHGFPLMARPHGIGTGVSVMTHAVVHARLWSRVLRIAGLLTWPLSRVARWIVSRFRHALAAPPDPRSSGRADWIPG